VDARKTLVQKISAELYRGLFPDRLAALCRERDLDQEAVEVERCLLLPL